MSTAPPTGPEPQEPPGPAGTPATTAPAGAAEPARAPHPYTEVQRSAEFGELRRRHRAFVFPLTIAFVLWYLVYILLSSYAGGFMAIKIAGNLNVALVLGLAQFLTTFLIAWWYSRHAAGHLDPKAEAIKSRLEGDA